MAIQIIGDFDRNKLYCVGSLTKFLTTYVCLSLLSETYTLDDILDDDQFFDKICVNQLSKQFLAIFQKIIGGKFSLRDICTYYAGLPYTFDLSPEELEKVDSGLPFKHHSIADEKTFLNMCNVQITRVYPNRSRFHYSEISIIFLGYLIEKAFNTSMESLYQKYIINRFGLQHSLFSRTIPANVYKQDLSDKYDYPAIAIQDHGYFCYSNGYYTTLIDEKLLLEGILQEKVFKYVVDVKHARAASNRLMNGLTVEIRMKDGDIIYGYEGLSFSGCNIWAYSEKYKTGYLTFTNSEEDAYPIIYDQFGYSEFDKVPEYTQKIYENFMSAFRSSTAGSRAYERKDIPHDFQGSYHRVNINEKTLDAVFTVGNNYIVIRNPDETKYEVIFLDNTYRIKNKDGTQGSKVGLYKAKSGRHYMFFDGNLYRKIK